MGEQNKKRLGEGEKEVRRKERMKRECISRREREKSSFSVSMVFRFYGFGNMVGETFVPINHSERGMI